MIWYGVIQPSEVCVSTSTPLSRTPVPNRLIPMISEAEEATVVEPSLEQRAQSRLLDEGYYFLEELTHLLPQAVHQAIVDDTISSSWYAQMRDRVRDLKRGHLSSGDSDHTQGAIHWFEGELLFRELWPAFIAT